MAPLDEADLLYEDSLEVDFGGFYSVELTLVGFIRWCDESQEAYPDPIGLVSTAIDHGTAEWPRRDGDTNRLTVEDAEALKAQVRAAMAYTHPRHGNSAEARLTRGCRPLLIAGTMGTCDPGWLLDAVTRGAQCASRSEGCDCDKYPAHIL